MEVREGMSTEVLTITPQRTLREAAHHMAECNCGSAVVMDPEQPGPGIITERDILRSSGSGEDIDAELVGDHLSPHLIYAYEDWPLEKAAEEMTRGHFRHVIVLDSRSEPVGILSMRDIVRCWMGESATSDVA